MKFMTLDLAAVTGYAIGEAGSMPKRSGSVRLKARDEPMTVAIKNLACFIRDTMVLEDLEAIVVERFIDPSILNQNRNGDERYERQRRSPEAIISQIQMHGVALGMAGVYGTLFYDVVASKYRKHFMGVAHANTGSRGPKTAKQKDQMRQETKNMVIRRCWAIGYMSRDKSDDNHADACALYDYSSCVLFKQNIGGAFRLFESGVAK